MVSSDFLFTLEKRCTYYLNPPWAKGDKTKSWRDIH